MDVFYYWKNLKEDLAHDRIGWFRSSREKIDEIAQGCPDFIWVFKTPVGFKGQVQLIGRLKWEPSAVVKRRAELSLL